MNLPENVRLLVDERAADLVNFAAGANEDGKHSLTLIGNVMWYWTQKMLVISVLRVKVI